MGRNSAKTMVRKFLGRNYVIVSGLAMGIDTIAHQSAMNVSKRKTIAVLGSGIDNCYPSKNCAIYENKNRSLIVSEYPGITTKLH